MRSQREVRQPIARKCVRLSTVDLGQGGCLSTIHLITWLALVGAVPAAAGAGSTNPGIDTVFVGAVPDGRPDTPVSIMISADGWNVAFRTTVEGGEALVVNGVTGARYAEIGQVVFGPGGTIAYLARRGREHHLVVGTREVRRIPPGDDVSDLQFDRDGRVVVFVLKTSDGSAVFVGDSAGHEYPAIVPGSVRFCPGSGGVAYVAEAKGKRFVVAAGIEPVRFDDVLPPIFGASNHFACLATRESSRLVVTDHGTGSPYDEVTGLALDPARGVPVYAAALRGAWRLVVDGMETLARGRITDVCVNPSGGHVAYAVMKGPDHFVVRDSTMEGPFETVVEGSMCFSRDGRHLAYEAERHDEFFVVADGREGPKYSDVVNGSIQMSPDGIHLAYLAERGSRQFLVLDGVEGAAHEGAEALTLSPGGSHVAFVATDLGQARVVIDGVAGLAWDAIIGNQLHFDGEEGLHYIARRGSRLFRVSGVVPSR